MGERDSFFVLLLLLGLCGTLGGMDAGLVPVPGELLVFCRVAGLCHTIAGGAASSRQRDWPVPHLSVLCSPQHFKGGGAGPPAGFQWLKGREDEIYTPLHVPMARQTMHNSFAFSFLY